MCKPPLCTATLAQSTRGLGPRQRSRHNRCQGDDIFFSGIKMTGVSTMSLLIFVVFARFLTLTATFWQVNNHQKRQELTMNQSKTTLFRSRNLKGLVFLSPDFLCPKHINLFCSPSSRLVPETNWKVCPRDKLVLPQGQPSGQTRGRPKGKKTEQKIFVYVPFSWLKPSCLKPLLSGG